MDVRKAIERRRSVRVFDYERPVSDRDLATILEAARRAPSWKNEQPWRFVAVRSPETRDRIVAALTDDNPARGAVAEASVVIVVLGVPEEGEIHQGKPFYLVDCGIAGQNLFLQAVELGLASVWVSLVDGPAVCRALGAPVGWECVGMFPIGYPLEGEYEKRPRPRKATTEVCFLDRVGNPLPF